MSSEDFKIVATEYAAMCKEIQRVNASVRDMKKKKDELAETILNLMKQRDLDECQLSTGEKIIRKTSKRTSTLKPEMIFDEFKSILNDEAKATQALQNIQSKREVVEKEVISFSAARGSSRPSEPIDDL